MFQMTAGQKILLKGIAELSAAIWTLDHSDTFTPNDHNRLVRLRRAYRALLHDADTKSRVMLPRDASAWQKLVVMAETCCTHDQAAAFGRALELRFDPQQQSVYEQTTLPGME
jgi:hypothetical protein